VKSSGIQVRVSSGSGGLDDDDDDEDVLPPITSQQAKVTETKLEPNAAAGGPGGAGGAGGTGDRVTSGSDELGVTHLDLPAGAEVLSSSSSVRPSTRPSDFFGLPLPSFLPNQQSIVRPMGSVDLPGTDLLSPSSRRDVRQVGRFWTPFFFSDDFFVL
jgi:hypothetical protein